MAQLDYKEAETAAMELGVEKATILGLLESGQIPGVKLGGTWVVSAQSLAAYLSAEETRQFQERRGADLPPNRDTPTLTRRRRAGNIEYVLLGKRHVASTAIGMLIDVLRALDARDTEFLPSLSKEKGRLRRYVARRPEDLYPGRPDLSHYSSELRPGWWVGTNHNRKVIESILKKACHVAGLKWGIDIFLGQHGRSATREKALAFVGAAADSASDVARRHDEYFAESLTHGRS
jgi:excisionase family DNA binding protein